MSHIMAANSQYLCADEPVDERERAQLGLGRYGRGFIMSISPIPSPFTLACLGHPLVLPRPPVQYFWVLGSGEGRGPWGRGGCPSGKILTPCGSPVGGSSRMSVFARVVLERGIGMGWWGGWRFRGIGLPNFRVLHRC